METVLSTDTLRKIHEKVYEDYGYPTVEEGLRALKRARRWQAENLLLKQMPPAGIKNKLEMWVKINKDIEIEIIKQKEKERAKLAESKEPSTT